jgi:hypothetical protein
MNLEQRLLALAPDAFPPTPDLVAWAGQTTSEVGFTAHARRTERFGGAERVGRRRWLRSRWLPLALAALLVPTTAGAVILLAPEHIRIEYVQTLPELPTNAPDLGERASSVDEASQRAGFAVQALPRRAARIHVLGDLVTLAYSDVVITETRARREIDALVKTIGPGTATQRVQDGWFISGAPHEVAYLSPDGRFTRLPPRLAGNTLAIERDGLVIRIEGERLSLPRALELSQRLAAPGSR